ncbi:MAG: hypothetical protein Q9M21_00540 [Mariprofundaceae bacterium]|nr:hypothetical protein [Mariprofundaceae bacterium]
MKYIVVIMMLFALAACQNEEKTEAPVAMVEKHEPVNTQAVKKDDSTPAVVQKNVEKTSQAVVKALSEGKAVVNPCSVKPVVKANPCAVKKMVNPCSVKAAVKANPCSVKKVVNPCSSKAAAKTNPCAAKKMVNPCSAKALVKVTTNFTGKCKACHKVSKDAVGPSFKKIQAAYGSSTALAKVFESGFVVGDRKVAASEDKYKKKASMMTSQYKKLIKKKVEAGKFTYQALADEIFSK